MAEHVHTSAHNVRTPLKKGSAVEVRGTDTGTGWGGGGAQHL